MNWYKRSQATLQNVSLMNITEQQLKQLGTGRFYHGTSTKIFEEIKKLGYILSPTIMGTEEDESRSGQLDEIFYTINPDYAARYAMAKASTDDSEPIVLELDVPYVDIKQIYEVLHNYRGEKLWDTLSNEDMYNILKDAFSGAAYNTHEFTTRNFISSRRVKSFQTLDPKKIALETWSNLESDRKLFFYLFLNCQSIKKERKALFSNPFGSIFNDINSSILTDFISSSTFSDLYKFMSVGQNDELLKQYIRNLFDRLGGFDDDLTTDVSCEVNLLRDLISNLSASQDLIRQQIQSTTGNDIIHDLYNFKAPSPMLEIFGEDITNKLISEVYFPWVDEEPSAISKMNEREFFNNLPGVMPDFMKANIWNAIVNRIQENPVPTSSTQST